MSFFMGLATGLAKSVDTQLKESIERTRDNIDMVSKWRLKKAEEREKERRTKDKEIETLIKDAAYVISGNVNDVDAQNIAAALYKERGLTGFTDDINFMKQQKEAGVGVRPIDYIKRANEDVEVKRYGLSEIVRSLSDAESSYAPSDMIFPKGTIKGSGLISAIAPDFDVTAAGGQRATDQMKQIGLTTTPVAPSLSFDRYTFDREGLGYATKSVNEKLSYLRNIMDDPSADPETAAEAGQRLDDLLNKSMTGEESSAIQAINLKLSRMSTQDTSAMTEMQFKAFDAERDSLVKRRQGLEDTIALRDAKTVKEKLAIEANIAFREGREEDGFRLMAESEDYGTQVTNATLINRVKSRATRLSDNEDYMNSTGAFAGDGFAEDKTRIQVLQTNEEALMGVSFDKVQAFATQIRQAALAEFKAQHPGMYKDLNITTNEDGTVDSTSFINALTNAKGNVSEKYNQILNSVIQRYKTIGVKHNVSEDTIDSAVMLLTGKGLPAATGGITGGTGDEAAGAGTGETEVAFSLDPTVPGPSLDFDMPTDEVMEAEMAKLSSDQVAALEDDFPNSQAGANSAVKSILNSGDTLDNVSGITSQLHDDEFGNLVTEEINKIEDAATAIANESAVSDITTPDRTVILSGVNKSKAVERLANEQQISSEAASSLLEAAVEKINAPILMKADQATPENVMKVLDKEGLIALGGGVAPLRRKKAILAVANAFGINPADAEGILDVALQVNKGEVDPEFAEKFMRNTLLGQIDVGDFKPENILTDAFKGGSEDSSSDEAATDTQDDREARGLVVPSTRTSPENRMRGASNAALIAAYISKDMSDLERKEIRRRLETDKSFVDQLAAVIDRVNKKKKGPDTKLTPDQLKALRNRTNNQQVPMARGGLMGR